MVGENRAGAMASPEPERAGSARHLVPIAIADGRVDRDSNRPRLVVQAALQPYGGGDVNRTAAGWRSCTEPA